MKSNLTLEDIAEAMGLSKSTISRAISGKGRISSATMERVRDYVKEHNYKPNAVAKALAKNRTYNIGVVWPGDSEAADLPFFQKCTLGMSQAAGEHGCDLLMIVSSGDDISNIARVITNRKVDGIIMTRTMYVDPAADLLKEHHVPYVLIGSSPDPDAVHIDQENFKACKELTMDLLGRGLRKIALIAGNLDYVINNTRQEAFESAFAEAGIPMDPSMIFCGQKDGKTDETVFERVLAACPDGIVCMDDRLAGLMMRKCRREHIRIPQQIALASFYHSSTLDHTVPAVTSISFDEVELGRIAVHTLCDMVKNRPCSSRIIEGYTILHQESTDIVK